jgi:hypothetical protein
MNWLVIYFLFWILECEQHINERLRQSQDALREQTSIATRLTNENNEIRIRLAEYKIAFSAASRLNDEIKKFLNE